MTVTCGLSTMQVTTAADMSRLLLIRVPGASLRSARPGLFTTVPSLVWSGLASFGMASADDLAIPTSLIPIFRLGDAWAGAEKRRRRFCACCVQVLLGASKATELPFAADQTGIGESDCSEICLSISPIAALIQRRCFQRRCAFGPFSASLM